MVQLNSIVESPFDLRLPQLALVKENSFRSPKLSTKVSLSNKVWPKTFNRLWSATQNHRLAFKPFEFYVPFQRFFPFPSPTHGSFFRIQTHLFVFWYQFHSRRYCAILDYGTKEKKLLSESSLWLRQGYYGVPTRLTFWSFFQRTCTFSFKHYSLFFINVNNQPLYFTEGVRSNRWFEDSLADIRLFSWNFYSRLRTATLPTALSQASFDPKVLRRHSPWSRSSLWLSSPIHDYSVLITSFFSNKSMIMPEMFFQFYHQIQVTSSRWSQLFFCFWSFSNFSKLLRWSQVGSAFLMQNLLSFYGKSRFFLKLFRKNNKRLFFSFNFLYLFKNLRVLLRLPSLLLLKTHSSTVLYENKAIPLMSLLQSRNPFKPLRQPWNSVSLFPDKTLYYRYLRRQFFLSPSFVTSRFFLEYRLIDLNFFFSLFFQSFSLNKLSRLSQIIYLWAFCLSEITFSSTTPGIYARVIPNVQRNYSALGSDSSRKKQKEVPFVQASLATVDTLSEFPS